jgi:rfaE bifunctional protein kinase chain/domain
LKSEGASVDGIVKDPARPTTVKMRVIAHDQHVVRIDSEDKKDIDSGICDNICAILEKNIDSLDGIIIEDYNKGVITKDLIKRVIDLATRTKTIITVDPKFNNFFEYKNVTVFKPNKKETEEALGTKLKSEADILKAGALLLERLNAGHVLMTRSEHGMSLFSKKGDPVHIPTTARRIANVSGAGDTVIATLTMMLACGATMEEASTIANYAGGIVCGEVGIVPIDPAALVEAVKN